MRISARTATLMAVVVVGVPACTTSGNGPAGSPASSVSTPAANGTATATARPPSPIPARSGCVTGRTVVSWLPDRPSPPRLCVRVAAEVVVVLHAPGTAGRWQPPTSSDPRVADVGPAGVSQEGAVSATVYARLAGTAVISSYSEFEGDPHGPPSIRWQLILDVVP